MQHIRCDFSSKNIVQHSSGDSPLTNMDKLASMLDKFGRDLDKYPILVEVEKKTNCPKQYLVLGVGSVLLACLLLGFGASLIW